VGGTPGSPTSPLLAGRAAWFRRGPSRLLVRSVTASLSVSLPRGKAPLRRRIVVALQPLRGRTPLRSLQGPTPLRAPRRARSLASGLRLCHSGIGAGTDNGRADAAGTSAQWTDLCGSWRDSEGSTDSGRLELGPQGLHLESAGPLTSYGDLPAVSIGRGPADRLGGRKTVLLSRRNGEPLWIAPVAQHAALLELYDRLSAHVRER
jgi:hypothetical protein